MTASEKLDPQPYSPRETDSTSNLSEFRIKSFPIRAPGSDENCAAATLSTASFFIFNFIVL